MAGNKYEKYISRGVDSRNEAIAAHGGGGENIGPRFKLLWGDIVPESDIQVLVRQVINIGPETAIPDYVDRHYHDVSKAYIILSEEPGGLVQEVTLGDEIYDVKSPAAVFVPAGLEHHVRFKSGHGFQIMVMPTKDTYADHTFSITKK